MKQGLTLLLLIMGFLHSHAGDADSTKKATHHIQLVGGDYSSVTFMPGHPDPGRPLYDPHTQSQYYFNNIQGIQWSHMLPLYTFSMGFDYKVEFPQHVGLRTGINYFTYSYIVEGRYYAYSDMVRVREVVFSASLYIPVHVVLYKQFKKGRMVFDAGPDIYMPIHTYGKVTSTDEQQPYITPYTIQLHSHVTGQEFLHSGSLGLTAGLGYEWHFTHGISYELVPDIRLINAVPFDFQGWGGNIYRNYIWQTTIGLSTYVTFY